MQLGGSGPNNQYRDETRVELAEVIPGVFLEKRATLFSEETRGPARRDGRAGWRKLDLEVTEVHIEDFEYDDSQFDWKSLPISAGVHVTDTRHDPPLEFNHGVEPLDEEILADALRRSPASSYWPWVFGASLLLLSILGIWIAMRVWRSPGKA
jgi:hypothetical protein